MSEKRLPTAAEITGSWGPAEYKTCPGCGEQLGPSYWWNKGVADDAGRHWCDECAAQALATVEAKE